MKIKYCWGLLILYLFVLVFLPPQCLYSLGSVNFITSGLAALRYMLSFVFIVYLFLDNYYRQFIFSPYFFFFSLAIIFQVIALIQNGSFYLTAGLSCLTNIGFVAANIILFHKQKILLLKAYRNILIVYFVLHFVTLVLFPGGLVPELTGDGRVYFMGSKNTVTTYMILVLLVSYLLCYYDSLAKKKDFYILIVTLSVIAVLNASSTALVALIIIISYLVTSYFSKKYTNINRLLQKLFIIFVLSVIIGFFYFVILLDGGNNFLMNGLTSILGRDVTFSGRRAIWEAAIIFIIRAPLWGLGLDVQYDVWGNNQYVYSAHNTILDYGVKYGCISLFFMIISIIILIKVAVKKIKREPVRYALICVISLMFAMMFEAIEGFYTTWAIMLFTYLIIYYKDQNIEEKEFIYEYNGKN